MFVSSIETAANHWHMQEKDAVERLRAYDNDLYELLINEGGEELTTKVAKKLSRLMGANKKFSDFITAFMPDPPIVRPAKEAQFSFENSSTALSKIYKYRSEALHGGKPFPWPMCGWPNRLSGNNTPAEIPLGIASSTQGGTWRHVDTPMLLHTFEYIVRGSLLRWWQSMPK